MRKPDLQFIASFETPIASPTSLGKTLAILMIVMIAPVQAVQSQQHNWDRAGKEHLRA